MVLDDFHHLLKVHEDEFETIYDILVEETNDGCICDPGACKIVPRSYRDRDLNEPNDNEGNDECKR